MNQNYISGIRLSLWMRLVKKWNTLYTSIKEVPTLKNIKKLKNLSLVVGVKRQVLATALLGTTVLGAQAQVNFEEVTDREEQIFKKEIKVNSNSRPTFVDLDGDSDLDLVVGNSFGELKYFTKNNNTFSEQTGESNPFDGIKVGYYITPNFIDLDGDSDLDLVLGIRNGSFNYYQNDNNVFTKKTGIDNPLNIPNVGYNSYQTLANLDGDADMDLVVGQDDGTITYYTNNNNSFTKQTGSNNPFDGIDVGTSAQPTFADVDGDSDLDLIVGESNGTLIYFTNENTVFTLQTGANNPFDGIDVGLSSTPTFTDVDEDSDLDLVIGNRFGNVKYYKNEGNTFTYLSGTENPFGFDTQDTYIKPFFIDIDKDSHLDLIAGNANGTIQYYKSENNIFNELTGENNPFDGIDAGVTSTPTFVDIDGDSDLDLITGEYYGSIKYFTNDNNVFTLQTGINNLFDGIGTGNSSAPTFADIDGDLDLDLIIGGEIGKLKYFTNDNNVFTEQTGENNPFNGIDVGANSVPTFADIDGDSVLDLLIGEFDGTLNYFKKENNVFTEQTAENNPFDAIDVGKNSVPTFADLDGDSDLDLFVGNIDGQITEFKNNSILTSVQASFKKKRDLSIYPNPATSVLNTPEGELEILDLMGNTVLSTESNGTVDVSNLGAGIYVVSQNGLTSKLVIK